MFSSYPARTILALLMFGGTMAFSLTAFLRAIVDVHDGIPVWENDMAYFAIAISLGALCVMLSRSSTADPEPVELIKIEEIFPQD